MNGDDKGPDLARLQGWLQTVATHPAGLDEGIRVARGGIAGSDTRLEAIVESGFGIGARHRVGIYHRGYFARLLACLRAEYAVLSKTFTGEWFDEMGLRYLARCPSESWTLADLGAGFPAFLAKDRPDRDRAGADRTPAFDFIVELARLERTIAEINRGPGIEEMNEDLRAFDRLEHCTPDDIRIAVSPSLRLLRSRFALRQYFESAQADDDVPVPEAQPQWIALCRVDYRACLHDIDEWQFDLLRGLTEDRSLARALARVARRHPGSPAPERWPVWIGLCAERGFFAAIETA